MKPSSDQLEQIDRPAEDNLWHEAPDLSKTNLKSQLQSAYKSKPGKDAQEVVGSGAQAAREADGSAGDRLDAAQNATGTAVEQAKSNIDPETRESVQQASKQYGARTRQYLSRKMPEERRDQTIWRLKV